ncbi:unnamed protein product [Cylindrotheca closterium]|uniref:Uncharacterized protein n=1 Tax=Cylindrotheca closterium TaxID=2856 RepID=A0AAD2CU18_9STRA|nr:unnamed protein product [Cylindrotheca closterium]
MANTLFGTFCLVLLTSVQGFLPPSQIQGVRNNLPVEKTALNLHDMSEIVTAAANSVWLATIDADIDAIPENEFATVFAGGIGVMFGGVLSTMIVGFILEKSDIYGELAAESYLQAADDEEFWKGLSAEEKVMAEAALNRIKESRGEVVSPPTSEPAGAEESATPTGSSVEMTTEKTSQEKSKSSVPNDMFSDY